MRKTMYCSIADMVAIYTGKEVLIRNQFSVHNITNTYIFRGVGYTAT
jgi:hypothetical protein